jgi:protein-disulfide isomerase
MECGNPADRHQYAGRRRLRLLSRRDLFKYGFVTLGSAAYVSLQKPISALSQTDANSEIANKLLARAPAIGERSIGSPEAPVVVIEYASATCPHCARFHIEAWPQIRRYYVDTGKVRWIFREFPLDSLAMAAFMLARCIDREKYFSIIELLFRQQKVWAVGEARKELFAVMQQIGMRQDEFDACIQRKDLAEAIYNIAKTANSEFGVNSTPTFFVNGKLVRGTQNFDGFKTILEEQLAR